MENGIDALELPTNSWAVGMNENKSGKWEDYYFERKLGMLRMEME